MKILCFLTAITITSFCFAQKPNWQHLDMSRDSVMGISTNRAYSELLKGKKSYPVIVAVIDRGIDTNSQDLKKVLWNNPNERINGIDDDGDGYTDDVFGWNFIGSLKANVVFDNTELTRLVRNGEHHFGDREPSQINKRDLNVYWLYCKQRALLKRIIRRTTEKINMFPVMEHYCSVITKGIGKDYPSMEEVQNFQSTDPSVLYVKNNILSVLKVKSKFQDYLDQQKDDLDYYNNMLKYWYNTKYDPRAIVGDDYPGNKVIHYGNNDVMGPIANAGHGTAVAGIIAANKNNNEGMYGVADNVQIMAIRVVPDGEERDKDVANAIRYAVDHGARVINMSFSKWYQSDKSLVDKAVKYAVSKGALFVHSAGNDGHNLDVSMVYPNKRYADGTGDAKAWIEVGASSFTDGIGLKHPNSNYGKTSVDVFAPGDKIKVVAEENKILELGGTTIAAPIVSGIAALIWEYYPKLSALQVKDIIMNSVTRIKHEVKVQDDEGDRKMLFADLCLSGGIVNAYQALKLAESYK